MTPTIETVQFKRELTNYFDLAGSEKAWQRLVRRGSRFLLPAS